MPLKRKSTREGGPTDRGSPKPPRKTTDQGSPAPKKNNPTPERNLDLEQDNIVTKRYVEGRKMFFQDKLKEKNISREERVLYARVLQLYEEKKLPGKEGRFVSKLIQDGEIRKLNDLHSKTPYCIEVSDTEIVWSFLSPCCAK